MMGVLKRIKGDQKIIGQGYFDEGTAYVFEGKIYGNCDNNPKEVRQVFFEGGDIYVSEPLDENALRDLKIIGSEGKR